ncbi:malto-oligosyltrehalose trehalohydrolase [Candidatus Protochlamydia phocaeensis]|uniref:malto-oligosyltrehalose trehalohydrolase n=1 Tax=Candidatus Protochlamydia phocaeensis TaxID=1414722 RepID=UPI000837B43F|nr:malto-oligosyltrehalose trehalohydrolase [Candidatus Protochlamydia phocaeensis]
METLQLSRRLPIGAEIVEGGVHFRVWAPIAQTMEVVMEGSAFQEAEQSPQFFALEREEKGYFSGLISHAQEGSLYRFRIDGKEPFYPDPASRYQPKGPHGPSQVIDHKKFKWTDQHWKGVQLEGRVIYEMHIGTFTHQGTWTSAKRELLELADLGITVIEMMPVNEFPGRFGWGYDGVNIFAPTHLYGETDELRSFIDHAHALGIAVILDVVYNHFGPDGNYLSKFSPHYFTHKHVTEWGDAINFDGPDSEEVRAFYIANAGYWIEEYHFDGLRLDATQSIFDDSTPHILSEISKQVRQSAPNRHTYIIAENESQLTKHVHPIEEGGYGLDGLWNDDFHHTALVRLTGRNEAYYTDYLGTPQEFISAIKYGYLYQGQWYRWHEKKRGTPSLHLNPSAFINFIQNHDQVANSAHGFRIQQITDPGNFRAMTALMLLAPGTPLLFQGQEFGASTPFYYFADHNEELAELIFQGRREYFKQFASIATPEIQASLPVPADEETFLKCKLNFTERESHSQTYALHRDLLRIRRHDPVFNTPRLGGVDGAVLSPDAFVLRYFGDYEDVRLVIVNFGVDFILSPSPEPLLASPEGTDWELLWSSENSRYGGGGTPPVSTDNHWRILGHATLVLIPKKAEPAHA